MTRPKNVLYVSHTADLKGSAVSLYQLILGLDSNRFMPVAAFSKPGRLVDDLAARNVRCHVLKERGFLSWRIVAAATYLMDEARVDLVHLNSAVSFCKYVGIAAKLRRTPVIWHIREDPRSKRVRRLEKWIRRLADRVLVVSTELEGHFRSYPLIKIYNGVNIEHFRPGLDGTRFRSRWKIPKDAFLFGVVGTIEERKGTLLLMRAAEQVLQTERDAYFAVVGDGMSRDEGSVREFLSHRPSLSARVVLTGRLENIEEVMAAIDVLVMPSLWEGFPRSLVEAMASGKACVATEVGEIPYMLDNGRCGLMVPPGDMDSLAQAMERCLSRRDALLEMGLRARRRVVEEFTLERHVQRVQEVYADLLDRV